MIAKPLPAPKGWRAPRRRRRREASIEEACRLDALALGWVSRKMNGFGFNAWPDRLFLPPRVRKGAQYGKRRQRFWVEFKREGEEPTTNQSDIHQDLYERGEEVHVCQTRAEFTRILNAHHYG